MTHYIAIPIKQFADQAGIPPVFIQADNFQEATSRIINTCDLSYEWRIERDTPSVRKLWEIN